MSTRLLQHNGAQVLPPVADPRATVTAWAAHQACDADHRARNAEYRELAASLLVVDDTELCGARFGASDTERCTKPAGHQLEIHANRRYSWGPALVLADAPEPAPTGGLLDMLEETSA